MLKRIFGIVLFTFITLVSTVSQAALPAGSAPSLTPMLEKATPAVVNITVKENYDADKLKANSDDEKPDTAPQEAIAVGSGVIVSAEEGLIVTNAHVVKNEKLIVVTLKDGRHYRAKLIGKDEGFDLAILQIKAKHLTAMPFADSDQLSVGNYVVAIGSPFGLTQTVTSGVISALNRSAPELQGFENFIQTDAPINMGNSGGALINTKGELVGINTAIVSPNSGNIGIGFSIPSNMVQSVIAQLIQYGKVSRGVLGVLAQNITPELADAMKLKHNQGAMVTEIVPGTPAAKANIQVKDIIEKVNGKPAKSSEQLHTMLALLRPGSKITLTLLRDHRTLTVSTVVGDPKKILEQQQAPLVGGMRLQDFSELEPDGTTLKGAVVVSVTDTSDGAMAGLMPGDVITNANGKTIDSVNTLMTLVKTKPEALLVKIARGNVSLFLVIQQQG